MESAQAEVARIRAHFDGALDWLDARDTRALDPAAQITRQLLRAELARYQAEGVFPKNHDFEGRRPTFVDEHGTPCAMAHLMTLGGAGELVAEVAATKNHAYLDDLALDPRVITWLDAAGLTVAEAARIQPGYDNCYSPTFCLCGSEAPASAPVPGAVIATIVSASSTTSAAKVETVFGEVPFVVGDSIAVKTQDVVNEHRGINPAVGDRVFVPVAKEPSAGPYLFLARIQADGSVGNECNLAGSAGGFGYVTEIGPLTTNQLVNARKAGSYEACHAALVKEDACFGACPAARGSNAVGVCVYGRGYLDAGVDAGAEVTTDAGGDAGVGVAPPFNEPEGTPTAPPQTSSSSGSVSTPVVTAAPEPFAPGGGCSTTSAAPGSVAVLLAVAGALLARRRPRG